ncbi:quinone oxidoreductase family protein [Nocardia arthritidis]|uniref:Zinc-binding dehydrogenase n=1 Tax=Nocardia arthritidis TaxID=228602 RepID=A0A6G9YJI9_9NOCA|nr:zinc-binding alcohol dehydrogenase family protein [Nocardia arthritidis]QIS13364.1 zinc-binding dehydrogenase [Nocardia arthritidis]
MKAAILGNAGETPAYGDFAEPPEQDGRTLVDLVAAGIHPLVRSLASGSHYGSTDIYPLIPGVDAVARTADGTLVYTGFTKAPYGTMAERMSVPSGMHFPLPAGADPTRIAGGMNPGMSSWLILQDRLNTLRANPNGPKTLGTVLILGATGMAGLLAIQNAYRLGANRVIAVGRDAAALDRAKAYGAQTVTPTDRDETVAALIDAIGAEAPRLVLDYVWGKPAEAAFAALARPGLSEDDAGISYVQIGALAGAEAAVPASLLGGHRISISGSGMGSVSVQRILAAIPEYLNLIATGKVEVPVRTYPLAEISAAWKAAADSGIRAVVVPG